MNDHMVSCSLFAFSVVFFFFIFAVQSEQTRDPLIVIPHFSYSIILHFLVNRAAISCNHTCSQHLTEAWALIALLTCCRVIALTKTNSIYGPICRCLLSPACIAPSRLRWFSALFDLTHGGQNFRGLHASNLIPNEIDVCWTERSGWGWHTSSMSRLFLPFDNFILFFFLSSLQPLVAVVLIIFQGDG